MEKCWSTPPGRLQWLALHRHPPLPFHSWQGRVWHEASSMVKDDRRNNNKTATEVGTNQEDIRAEKKAMQEERLHSHPFQLPCPSQHQQGAKGFQSGRLPHVRRASYTVAGRKAPYPSSSSSHHRLQKELACQAANEDIPFPLPVGERGVEHSLAEWRSSPGDDPTVRPIQTLPTGKRMDTNDAIRHPRPWWEAVVQVDVDDTNGPHLQETCFPLHPPPLLFLLFLFSFQSWSAYSRTGSMMKKNVKKKRRLPRMVFHHLPPLRKRAAGSAEIPQKAKKPRCTSIQSKTRLRPLHSWLVVVVGVVGSGNSHHTSKGIHS